MVRINKENLAMKLYELVNDRTKPLSSIVKCLNDTFQLDFEIEDWVREYRDKGNLEETVNKICERDDGYIDELFEELKNFKF